MQSNRLKLSVIVPTGNRRDVIEDCLQSVRWADELIVVDSFSTDGTLDIARKYADRILQNQYGFSARQKNWAIPQAAHDWILLVDTDERIPPALREEIEDILTKGTEHCGYQISRLNFMLGKSVQGAGYYPDYQTRLFMKDKSQYQLRRVHAHLIVDGSIGTLRTPMIHYAHRSLDQILSNLLLIMTTWEAEERLHQKSEQGKLFSKPGIVFNLLFRPVAAFFVRYFFQGGWRDGIHGLTISILWGMYVALTYMKIWEHQLDLPQDWWNTDWQTQMDPLSQHQNNSSTP